MIKGKIGLANLGNTCYMNSVLQCLNHVKFKNWILKENKGREIVKELKELFWQLNGEMQPKSPKKYGIQLPKDMKKDQFYIFTDKELMYLNDYPNKSNEVVVPTNLKYLINIKINKFQGYDSHDCAEFLVNLLDLLKKETNLTDLFLIRTKIISTVINYEPRERINCWGREVKKIQKPETLVDEDNTFYLDIPIKTKQTDINDCIQEYLDIKDLSGGVKGTERIEICDLPEILVINLRRINKGKYDPHFINYPKELDLSEIVENDGIKTKTYIGDNFKINNRKFQKNKAFIYALNAFIIHEGHPLQGHKIAICLDENENKWYKFDDHKVTPCQNPFHQEVAFLFFYQRIK